MEQIRREYPMIFNRGVAVTRKIGFPDVIMPGKQISTNWGIDGSIQLFIHLFNTVDCDS